MNNKYLILVNKNNPMPDEIKFNIVETDSKYAKDRPLEEKTFEAIKKFRNYAKENGYVIDIESGYRSKDYQQKVWDELESEKGLEYTKRFVAVPGYSEHQTGLAVDVVLYENGSWYEDQKLKGHPIVDFLKNNCYKFGFIIRYPEGKENITGYGWEPWHLRYIDDVDKAKYIMENNLCLEEYLGN